MGTILVEKRKQKGVTQAHVAAAVGTDRSTYAHIENGRTRPSLPLAFSISRYYDSTVEELFGPAILPQLPSEAPK